MMTSVVNENNSIELKIQRFELCQILSNLRGNAGGTAYCVDCTQQSPPIHIDVRIIGEFDFAGQEKLSAGGERSELLLIPEAANTWLPSGAQKLERPPTGKYTKICRGGAGQSLLAGRQRICNHSDI
jgi:hypothetical protein